MNVVLVGGAGDGGRLVLADDQMHYDLAVYEQMAVTKASVEDLTPPVHHVEHYCLFRLHPATRAVIFAHEKLTPTDVMERLLEGYAPKDGPKVK